MAQILRYTLTKSGSQSWGIELFATGDERLVVKGLVPGSPGFYSTLEVGDLLVSANGRCLADMTGSELVSFLSSTNVLDLEFQRPGRAVAAGGGSSSSSSSSSSFSSSSSSATTSAQPQRNNSQRQVIILVDSDTGVFTMAGVLIGNVSSHGNNPAV